ncbi:RNA polymerase sigma factor [Paenibacillus wynnii]|uniref:RNA polymerase sigma factor n=1 Tax=Paenibacillus wynnii TaxID=268407 RepID=UPI000689BC72|nr:RNA polymerase sigma factor [Paenibacillus wynnii]
MIILDDNRPGIRLDDNSLRSLQTALNRYCLSLTHSAWEAEDLAQDTWVKALEVLKMPGNTNPEAMLLRIAKNTWIDGTRRKAIFYRVLERVKSKATAAPDSNSFETEIVMQALIKHLPPLQRTVFLMRDVLGFSAMETSERLKTTEGAVKAALFRARQAMQSVREEFVTDGPSLSEDEGFRAYLKALALSYEKGQLSTLLELALQNDIEKIRIRAEVRMAA